MSTGSMYPRKNRVAEVFRFAEASALDGVEVLCDAQDDTHDRAALSKLVQRHDVPIVSLHSPFPGGAPASWGSGAAEIVEETCKLAADLEARHVVVHLPERIYLRRTGSVRLPLPSRHGRELREFMADGGLCRLEDRYRLRICVENLPRQHRLISDAWLFHWNSLDDWKSVHRHLTLDTTHWATKDVSPLRALEAAEASVRHVHLSNYASREEHLPPQYGSLDLAGFLRRIATSGDDRLVVLELSLKHLPEEESARMMTLRQSVSFARGHLSVVPSGSP